MCVSVPARLLAAWERRGTRIGVVLHRSGTGTVDLAFVPDARPGDHVVVHAGVAVRRIPGPEAAAIGRLLEETSTG